jgi:hypothetical protein
VASVCTRAPLRSRRDPCADRRSPSTAPSTGRLELTAGFRSRAARASPACVRHEAPYRSRGRLARREDARSLAANLMGSAQNEETNELVVKEAAGRRSRRARSHCTPRPLVWLQVDSRATPKVTSSAHARKHCCVRSRSPRPARSRRCSRPRAEPPPRGATLAASLTSRAGALGSPLGAPSSARDHFMVVGASYSGNPRGSRERR